MRGKDDFEDDKETSINEILLSLLDDKDLELKTHIFRPKDLASLKTLARFLRQEDMTESSRLIEDFLEIYLKYMVSYDRLSRKEIITAVRNLLDKETIRMSLGEKFTTNLKS